MTKMRFTRTDFGLTPADDAARKFLYRVKPGRDVLMDAVAPHQRSMAQHRLFFALMKLVADNLENVTPEQVRKVILRRCGYADAVHTKRGVELIERSMAVHAMKTQEFEDFFRQAMEFVRTEWLPVAPEALADEVRRMAA